MKNCSQMYGSKITECAESSKGVAEKYGIYSI